MVTGAKKRGGEKQMRDRHTQRETDRHYLKEEIPADRGSCKFKGFACSRYSKEQGVPQCSKDSQALLEISQQS